MEFLIKSTKINGCFEIIPNNFRDERGVFVKIFHEVSFKKYSLNTTFVEDYYSISYRRVLRGLHFQLPPMDHIKMVCCVDGKVLDVVVDLRVGSPTYGDFEVFELDSEKSNIIYIPKGLAHGFYVLSEKAIMIYKVSTIYSPKHDAGILWNSVNIPWPDKNPIVSKRDSELIHFRDFKSPFIYQT